jgi:preprotein translocase subunit SecE
MVNKIVNYIKSSIEEMKKVTWPTKKETYNYTLLVIVISLAVAAFLGGLDYIFSWLLKIAINSKI